MVSRRCPLRDGKTVFHFIQMKKFKKILVRVSDFRNSSPPALPPIRQAVLKKSAAAGLPERDFMQEGREFHESDNQRNRTRISVQKRML